MDHFYRDALEHCHSYNCRLMAERQVRLPYLDSQTGVAQNNCNLWFEKRHRGPGLKPNQIYTYPSKRWKKKPQSSLPDPVLGFLSGGKPTKVSSSALLSDSVAAHLLNENSNDSHSLEFDSTSRSPLTSAIGEQDFQDDDDDYYDDERPKKRLRKGRGRSAGRPPRRAETVDELDRRHTCEYCGKKYKYKPGLTYHIQHTHQEEVDAEDEYTPGRGRHSPAIVDENTASNNATPGKSYSSVSVASSSRAGSLAGSNVAGEDDVDEDDKSEPRNTRGNRKQKSKNDYCDFCLGGADENKKTGEPEELVSCSDCGRSGHPSCLQFTTIMTRNVKKYRWQCIECKSCHLCGTSDNDDQLLFCDDCDRGYHMYCLEPPMEEPPEGSWICSLCEEDRKQRQRDGLPIE